jgi:DNA-binding NtrC family response regulator
MLNTHTAIIPVETGTDQLPAALGSFGLLHPPRIVRDVLIVEPDAQKLTRLHRCIDDTTTVVACSTFKEARSALQTYAPMLLVTNLRLNGYNGLHLVLLTAQFGTRSVVYIRNAVDRGIASEIRRFGAFYETEANLLRSLHAYVHGCLPIRDRRETSGSDRRAFPRGGRREADEALSLHRR